MVLTFRCNYTIHSQICQATLVLIHMEKLDTVMKYGNIVKFAKFLLTTEESKCQLILGDTLNVLHYNIRYSQWT